MENFDLSKRVKELRARMGLSQEQLADLSGLSLRTIQRVENGETVPRGDTLKRLAVTLHVSPDEIIDWQVIEDNNVLVMLNLSQLGFIAFPLLGIIIPLAIWVLKKDSIKDVDNQGKSIINFQISWVIFLFSSFVIGIFILSTFILIVVFMFYLYNIILIIMNTKRVYRSKSVSYKPRFAFLK